MADAAVSYAIQTLDNFLTQQFNIRSGVKDGVKWLKDELGYLQSSVRYAESRQDEELIRNWVNDIREVAREVEAILHDFRDLQAEHAARRQGVFRRLIRCVCMWKKEVNFGREIESLKERVMDIKKRRNEYGINDILANPNVQPNQRTLLRRMAIENEVDVVGFEDAIETLKGELDSEDLARKVIAIHGMGGLGKTSLAIKLYNSSDLRRFDTRAKVCVSKDYNIKDVLKRLIKSVRGTEQNLSEKDQEDLLQDLRQLLQDRGRYFVVIDDIWDTEVWQLIKNAFPCQVNGSRIIITTRKEDVALKVADKCSVHQLRFLTEEESWQLFCKREKPPRNLENLGKEMVRKCGGLPLAIVVLSGLLLHKKNKDFWLNVKADIWKHLKGGDRLDIEEILSLSCSKLSYEERACFLYLARFPEDHNIDVHVLKLLWIAEEFIYERDGVPMELAEDILNELINRNLIQIARFEWNGDVEKCRVHDVVLDLAKEKAEAEKRLVVFDSSSRRPKPIHLLGGVRHSRHAIYSGIGDYIELFEGRSDALNVRSLALNELSGGVELEQMKMMYTRFKNLRVLDLRSMESDTIPEEIGYLVLLKFLGLMGGSRFSLVIPPSIGKLKKLQTLCGSDMFEQYIIPREIWELKELRHITCGEYSGSHQSCSQQTKLQTLDRIGLRDWVQIDTLTIPNVQTLSIFEEGGGRGAFAYALDSVANLTSLQTFSFKGIYLPIPIQPLWSCKFLKTVDLCGPIKDPSALNFLPDSVTSLSLSVSRFTEDPMPILGNLTNLTTLALFDVYHGKKMVCNHNAFPSLQFLSLEYMFHLEEWQVGDQALPFLTSFKTSHCERLKMLPMQLERLRREDLED